MGEPARQTTVPCWECETATTQPVTVVLPIPNQRVRVPLCQACYRAVYLPLVKVLAEAR